MFPVVVSAEELQIGKFYSIATTVEVQKVGYDEKDNIAVETRTAEKADKDKKTDTTENAVKYEKIGNVYTALKNSKFKVIAKTAEGNFVVQFNKIYDSDEDRYKPIKWVKWDETYILNAQVFDTFDVSGVSTESLTGLSSGPLVVPFKFRTGDKSLSGDATIGMYAGMTFEPFRVRDNWCFRFTPLISAGLSQVAVSDGDKTENKTSATWAAGFLISSWSTLNIGVVYGQDRIGDSSWEYEGDGWVSIMVGWHL